MEKEWKIIPFIIKLLLLIAGKNRLLPRSVTT